ncbi:MAG TPA: citrate synthase [Erysipelothrix sp.]|nr:citrate synthase [Erysipelothrix sp.]
MVDENLFKLFSRYIPEENIVDKSKYRKHDIKHGLRNEDGTGVLVGITHIAEVVGYDLVDGKRVPKDGELYYRGINVDDLIEGVEKDHRFGFEETVYLLLFNKLPNKFELESFVDILKSYETFPDNYMEDVIIKIPADNIMNKLQRAFLTLYSYDKNPDDISVLNVLNQSLNLIAKAPLIMIYSYYVKRHHFDKESLILHKPCNHYSISENILHMLRSDNQFTDEEARLLDILMIVQAEHGGGNNSTFATHVVSSTGTDTYSALSTAIGSLKGPKHGGANLKVQDMLENIKENVDKYWEKAALEDYLVRMLDKEVYDKQGLIYGIGHAVYTKSDARVRIIKQKCIELANDRECQKDLQLILNLEEIGGRLIQERKNLDFTPSGNIDLYSSFVMEMLKIPKELYTPMFAISRMAGWSAHRLEQILDTKIMRPGYVTLGDKKEYTPYSKRK